jgi:integrase
MDNKRKVSEIDGYDKDWRKRYKELAGKMNQTDKDRLRNASPEKVLEFCAVGAERSRSIQMRICSDIGADVSLIEQDLNLYKIFLTKTSNLSTPRRFFDRYFKPMFVEIGEDMFKQPNEESTRGIIHVVTQKCKGQWSTVSMWIPALKTSQVHPDFIPFAKDAILANSPAELWKMAKQYCIEDKGTLRCPITKQKIIKPTLYKTFMKLLGEHPTTTPFQACEEMNPRQVELFCVSGIRRQLSSSRVVAVLIAGFKDTQFLMEKYQRQEKRLLLWDDVFRLMNADFHGQPHVPVFEELIEKSSCDNLEDIACMSVVQLKELITGCSCGRNTFRIVEYLIRHRHRDVQELALILPHHCTEQTMTDLFQSTPWRTKLFEDIMQPHNERVVHSSHNPELRLKEIGYMAIKHLLFMETYTLENMKDKLPQSIDPLRWLFGNATINTLSDIMIDYGNKYEPSNQLVKSTHDRHHASYVISLFVRLLRDDLKSYLMCADEIHALKRNPILRFIPNKRVSYSGGRRTFNNQEVQDMIEASKKFPGYELMITLLHEVGLRVGCISTIMYYDLVTIHNHPRHVCRVVEKKRQLREFVTGPNLKQVLVSFIRHIETEHPNLELEKFYMFNMRNPHRRLSTESVRKRLKKIGMIANVGVVVHPHVFRHTIVGVLIEAGNSMDTVSKFIGHKNTDVTFRHYWLRDCDSSYQELVNPHTMTTYTKEEKKEEEDDNLKVVNSKVDSLMEVVAQFKMIIFEQCNKGGSATDVRAEIVKRMPNLDKVLQAVASSVNGETMSNISSISYQR